jgi:hypothetical protein
MGRHVAKNSDCCIRTDDGAEGTACAALLVEQSGRTISLRVEEVS